MLFPIESNAGASDHLQILLADDNRIEQKIAERMFRDAGYEVDVVSNGFEVVQAVRLKPYDVVLLDEHMPNLNAYGTTSRIRTLPALWKQPWIIVCADSDVDLQRTGIDDVLRKPYSETALNTVLSRVQHVGRQRQRKPIGF